MPWKRINGHRYFYLARREQGRVVQEYVGNGPEAEAVAAEIEMRRQERALQLEERANEQRPYRELDSVVSTACEAVQGALAARLKASGHHCHRGEWRRTRDRP